MAECKQGCKCRVVKTVTRIVKTLVSMVAFTICLVIPGPKQKSLVHLDDFGAGYNKIQVFQG